MQRRKLHPGASALLFDNCRVFSQNLPVLAGKVAGLATFLAVLATFVARPATFCAKPPESYTFAAAHFAIPATVFAPHRSGCGLEIKANASHFTLYSTRLALTLNVLRSFQVRLRLGNSVPASTKET